MKKRKNILIIGYFGYVDNQLDGQTVRTRSIYKLVARKLTNYNINNYDTQKLQSNKLSIFRLISYCIKSHSIFYLPGQNNLKYFFLPLFFLSKALNINLYYFAIGGWLPEFIHRRYFIKKSLSKLKVIFVQNKAVKQKLIEQQGFKNISMLPNFRLTEFTPAITENNLEHYQLKIVFMGRVHPLKGIDTIFRMSEQIYNSFDESPMKIDFYGPIDKNIETYFYCNVEKFGFINYKGILEPDDIYDTLSKYDVLVLPTKYPGEGFPGSILDAYISGIPVIVSNYKYLSEVVEEGKSGFLIDVDDEIKLFHYIKYLYSNPEKLIEMKHYAYTKSKQYTPEVAWESIKKHL